MSEYEKDFRKLHVSLASDSGYKKVFPYAIMNLDEVGKSKLCGGKRPPCHLCQNMKDTCIFKSKHLDEIHQVNKK